MIKAPPHLTRDIREFHEKFELTYKGKPRSLPIDLLTFRLKFLLEELEEYELNATALADQLLPDFIGRDDGMILINLERALDALVDLVYVALGTSYLHGFNFDEAWRRVHHANMQKVRAPSAEASEASSGRGSTYDVIKPPGWEPPRHVDLVEDHAHRQVAATE